ncbi:integrase family protein [Malikia sp.]|uniref:tyrosine-type recombinase/integrase n=1 Tax=Malikia sp. TaxID=2070706 RepID=UPI002632FF31|nr:integrase family protein [Malikia sp.]MDD2729174.1 integrase family protein [Malikia sp.]
MAKVAFTAGRVAGFKCPADKKQAFMWDATTPGLGLRATPSGKPAYVFQGVYQGKDVRITIGNPTAWSIPDAQAKARELQRLIDEGKDPRDLKREAVAAHLEKQAAAAAQAVTVGTAWAVYIEARRAKWGDSHHQDHHRYAQAGGEPKKRGKGKTEPGPLHPLMALPLRDLTADRVQAWAAKETAVRPTVTRNAWRLLRAFLSWCTEHPDYAAAVPSTNPAQARKVKEVLGKPGVKQDALQREQLSAWFTAVQGLTNATVAAYLQVLLLTGARPGEVLALRWEDVNVQWRGLTIRDKVEGERVIPLTAYVHHLLAALPRRNAWVFASPTKKDAHLTEPNHAHDRACAVAGIEVLTLHGLRRSFKSLTEWLEIPAGVVAQIMGHKPSATAEKHYTVRPLDLLRLHHERIEAWMLEQAGIQFDRAAEPGKLALVKVA